MTTDPDAVARPYADRLAALMDEYNKIAVELTKLGYTVELNVGDTLLAGRRFPTLEAYVLRQLM